MNHEWIAQRDRLFFQSAPELFPAAMQAFREECRQRFAGAANDEERKAVVRLLTEITIDTPSFLTNWNQAFCRMDADTRAALLDGQCQMNLSLLSELGESADVEEAARQIARQFSSQLMKLAKSTASGKLKVLWGNDSASGIMEAERLGASFVTTNPPIINIERKAFPQASAAMRESIRAAMPDADGVALAQQFTQRVVLENCKALYSLFRATNGYAGFACYQVNPLMCDNVDAMCEEAERTYRDLARELNGTPNVEFKLPGTSASIEAARRLTRQGIGVTITGSYTVSQHHAFAEAIEGGCAAQSFVVMMSGRLDTPIAEELKTLGVENADTIARFASAAVLSKSYALMQQKGYQKSNLLIASLRGPWNILAGLTNRTPSVYISVFPNKADEFESEERVLQPGIDAELPIQARKVLEKSRIFRQAYYEEELPVADFDAFLPLNNTLDGFRKDYQELMAYMLA